jgi:hypothetical protein
MPAGKTNQDVARFRLKQLKRTDLVSAKVMVGVGGGDRRHPLLPVDHLAQFAQGPSRQRALQGHRVVEVGIRCQTHLKLVHC